MGFFYSEESIKHLFLLSFCSPCLESYLFYFRHSSTNQCDRYVWKLAKRVNKITGPHILLGVCALVWVLWNRRNRNDWVYNNTGTIHFCRLYDYPLDLQIVLSFFQRHIEFVWILDAFVRRRLRGLSTTKEIVGFLEDNKMHMHFILFLFCWLIFVTTLCDRKTMNSEAVVCINCCRGRSLCSPFEK
jgi:hypothetical protein